MLKKTGAGSHTVNTIEGLLTGIKAGLDRQKQILTGSAEMDVLKSELADVHGKIAQSVADIQSMIDEFHGRMKIKEEAWNETTSKLEAELKERGRCLKEEAKKWKTLLQEKENQYKTQIQELKNGLKELKNDAVAGKRTLMQEFGKAEEQMKEEIKLLTEKLTEAKRSFWNRIFPPED